MLKKKPASPAPYLVPFFFTLTLVLELPLRPVLPETLRNSFTYVILPELFATLIACGCHFVITTLCLGLTSGYLLYQSTTCFGTKLLSLNSVWLLALSFFLVIAIAEKLRRNQFAHIRKLIALSQERVDMKSIIGKLPEGIIIARRKRKNET